MPASGAEVTASLRSWQWTLTAVYVFSGGEQVLACIVTASRGRSGGPYLVHRGRRMSMRELSWCMGIDIDSYRRASMSPSQWGHAVGNVTPLCLTERVLAQALMAVGILSPNAYFDRWEEGEVLPQWGLE